MYKFKIIKFKTVIKKYNLFKVLIVLLFVSLTSCATIFNSKKTTVNISTDKASRLIYKADTIAINIEKTKIYPTRSKLPLDFTIITDSLTQNFSFKRKTSILFWLNLNYTYGLGMLVDFTNPKRFTYNKNLHFITDSITNSIVLSSKKVTLLPKNNWFLYTSPLQAIDAFSTPMLTLGTEYFFKDNISISAEYGRKYTALPRRNFNVSFLKNKAALYRVETKWYNGINLTNNVHLNEYLGLEYRLLKSQFNQNIRYFESNNRNSNNFFTIDDFATKKSVSIINLKYGVLVPLGKQLYFDFYSGFGVRIKSFKHFNLQYNRSIHTIDDENSWIFGDYNRFQDYNRKAFFNYSLGFKFGIKL